MGDYEQLKEAISDVIKTNGNQEITGAILQNALLSIISTIGENATFAGIAEPTTNPGTPDGNVFWIAGEPGTYSNFNGTKLTNEVLFFINENGSWQPINTHIPTLNSVNDIALYIYGDYNIDNSFSFKGYINPAGGFFSNVNQKTTDFIDIEFTSIKYNIEFNLSAMSGVSYINFYDEEKNHLPDLSVNYRTEGTHEGIINRPAGAKFCRITSTNAYSASAKTSSGGIVNAIGTLKNEIEDNKNEIEDNKNKIENIYDDVDNLNSTIYGDYNIDNSFSFKGYINPAGGFFSNVNQKTTDFIDIEFTSIKYNIEFNLSAMSGVSYINFYDEEKNHLPDLSVNYRTEGTHEGIINRPAGAKFCRITSTNAYSASAFSKSEGLVEDVERLLSGKNVIDKNMNYVGMSIWWYDGKMLANGMGGNEIAIGYQSLIKRIYNFLSDTGTSYCYSGHSLGGLTEKDASSICNKMGTWQNSEKAIWTLDTITNDFKRNIPIGTIADYTNNTGKTTYYGALRIFADKIQELSGDDKIVIVSNACRRNNGGYTSMSTNTVGATLLSYEKALMEIAVKNKWWFVDQFRLCGVTDDTIAYTTIDGLHLNNLGYKLAVIPWINVLKAILN